MFSQCPCSIARRSMESPFVKITLDLNIGII
jgi:hypothetical protein